jgi:hypothetical protein
MSGSPDANDSSQAQLRTHTVGHEQPHEFHPLCCRSPLPAPQNDHATTSSASTRMARGNLMTVALAVFWFRISSNLLFACC